MRTRTFFVSAVLCCNLLASAFGAEPALRVVAEAGKVVLLPDVPPGTPAEVKLIGAPPSFTIILAVFKDGKIILSAIPVTIGGAQPQPPGPVIPPAEPLTGLALLVNQWTADVPADVRAASSARLAASFESLAAKIGAGALKTPKEIVAEAQAANKAALGNDRDKWAGVMDKLRVHLNAEATAGRLSTPDQHKDVFLAIAKGLRRVP